ncbi:MAG: bifunctional DNA primase/helicase, partial [Tannerella sp.]|nr:bifunctional DNA primase/helicase [Tannerella sp.]
MLKKDELLRRTSNGLDVFKHYIPGQWRVGHNFLNPLYEDRKASCNIYFDRRSGCYRMKDFGNDACSGDCFDTVGKLKNLNCSNSKDFVEILGIINNDLHLGLDDDDVSPLVVSVSPRPLREFKPIPLPQPEPPKKAKPCSTIQQSFSAKETEFWRQYGITPETLK